MLGTILGFVAKFFVGIFKDWRRDRALTDKGRTERDLEVQKETTEVLARNNEAGNMVDQMDDAAVDEEFKKL